MVTSKRVSSEKSVLGRRALKASGAFSQITLMVLSVVAISFLLGQSVVNVDGQSAAPVQTATVRNVNAKNVDLATKSLSGGLTEKEATALFGKLKGWSFEGSTNPYGLTQSGNQILSDFQGTSVNVAPDVKNGFLPLVKDENKLILGDGKTRIQYGKAADGSIVRAPVPEGREFLSQQELTLAAQNSASEYEGSLLGFTTVKGNFLGHLADGFTWGLAVAGAVQLIGNLAGFDAKLTNTLSASLGLGILAGKTTYGLFSYNGWTTTASKFLAGGIGVGVAALIFIMMYKKEKTQVVTFQCLPWEPPLGGAKCEECNKDAMRPCSEYRCKSLGQACQLLNPGTKEERCAWVNPKDVKSPVLTTSASALKPKDLVYTPDNAVRPPALGFKIEKTGNNKCLAPYTALEFGIIANEPAQCKIDFVHTPKMDDMRFFMGESNAFRYNHTEKMRLPSPAEVIVGGTGYGSVDVATSEGAPVFDNNGRFNLYIRCRDANGNENPDEFAISYCVDKAPDTTPPIIEDLSILSGSPVTYNIDKVPIELYANEPVDCKWSRQDKAYADMENQMTCPNDATSLTKLGQFICRSNLTAIENQKANEFYFRCKDNPGKAEKDRNVNVASKQLILSGTQPLNIVSTAPNETITGSTTTTKVTLKVTTDDGAEEGKASCSFALPGQQFITMFNTNSHEHSQELDLATGTYTYNFRCMDNGGNSASSNTTFTVFVDKQQPRVTRAYKETDALKIATDEDAECRYSISSCNFVFAEGKPLIYSNPSIKNNHYVKWDSNVVYYIKCKDGYGNEPLPNGCSITASPSSLGVKSE